MTEETEEAKETIFPATVRVPAPVETVPPDRCSPWMVLLSLFRWRAPVELTVTTDDLAIWLSAPEKSTVPALITRAPLIAFPAVRLSCRLPAITNVGPA